VGTSILVGKDLQPIINLITKRVIETYASYLAKEGGARCDRWTGGPRARAVS